MQSLTALCTDASNFPQNLDRRYPSLYNRSLHEQLNHHAERLFAKEDQCSLDFLELGHSDKGMAYKLRNCPLLDLANAQSSFYAHLFED